MVALFVVAIMVCALTADYVVQRLALRAPSYAFGDIFLDASHLWIKPEPSGLARVGADDVVGVLLGRPWRIEWSPMGQVKRGAPLAVVHGQGRSLTLRSPVDGDVVEQNTKVGEVLANASLQAFDAGWLVRMRPVELAPRLAAMKTGAKLRDWSRQEMDRLRAYVLSRLPAAAVGITAADGGPLAPDLASRLDDNAWDEAVRLMLGMNTCAQGEMHDQAVASAGGRT
jgi:glycine cleavage system H lipoate-binding protein